ncbi:hypothetical protein [Mesorhizobium sp.]|uniref:hypothetical protein n=1 Tax=Mesorhizobium sp. TaxID=1871066 RepID=UPI001211503A|nr:hypothetical protein [Mesorhizobium sp.]TIN84351.1 MAG: hypothetical protein E5X97_22550 [Mesorhizobium sp.]
MNVWGNSWGNAWGVSWAEAVVPPVASLLLGTVSIGPALAAQALMRATLADSGVSGRPMLAGAVSIDEED